jgi:manganese/zinc/iron transport system permease protein
MIELLTDFTFQSVLIGTVLLGALSGGVGSFAVLRGHSLLGDVISHAAFPGIALAFLVTWSKNPLVLLTGGAVAGLLGATCVSYITRYSRLKHDTALGIVLSVFFGTGLVLLTHLQKESTSNQSVLNKFLFGNAATLLPEDSLLIFSLAVVYAVLLLLFWKELHIVSFDDSYAKTLGYNVARWDFFFSLFFVVVIVVGLQTTGVVLASSLLVAPAAAARQWTNKLSRMILLATFFGAVSSVGGTLASVLIFRMPTGPAIVVILSLFVLFSLLCAPAHGLVWNQWRKVQ